MEYQRCPSCKKKQAYYRKGLDDYICPCCKHVFKPELEESPAEVD